MARRKHRASIGNWIAPPRFILFMLVTAAAIYGAIYQLKPPLGVRLGIMAGFDVGALVFFVACIPLLTHKSERMRISACRNDANRAFLLLITGAVSLVILASIVSEMRHKNWMDHMAALHPGTQQAADNPWVLPLIIGTLAIAWIFSNFIYALHYAHLFYSEGDGGDAGGLTFPETPEPDYWDFLYFSICLGMTFQTSDITITSGGIRRTVTLHCLEAFVFNLGVIAFTLNVLLN